MTNIPSMSGYGGMPAPQPEPMPEELKLLEDVSETRWIKESLADWGRVRSFMPSGFSSYARIFHPAYLDDGTERRPVRWSTVASWSGTTVHPQMQFPRLVNPNLNYPNSDYREIYRDPPWGDLPEEGSIPEQECRALRNVLRDFTSTPDRCFYCLWDGYGGLDPRLYEHSVRVETFKRTYLLFQGALDAVTSFQQKNSSFWTYSPNIWWPEDRAWCVTTDIDLFDTYVGGSDECIEAVLNDPALEALPTTLDAKVSIDGDTINVRGD